MKDETKARLDLGGLSPLRARVVGEILSLIKREGLKSGKHLVEVDLAERIGVSRSPVSFALGFLSAAGLASHDRNRGYFLAIDADQLDMLSAKPLEDSLYETIADDRIAGRLPDELSEAELMRRYAVARTRLLTVLSRIRAEGWIERQLGHGWRFLPLIGTSAAYAESYAFRSLIEPSGLLMATFAADPERLALLRERQEGIREGGYLTMTARELFEANTEFHETLAAWSGNRFILESLVRIDMLRRLVEYRQARGDRQPRRDQASEHIEILDALEGGDREGAAAQLRQHLERAGKAKSIRA
ncbi:MAG: GntR family transcriptional regulator [Spirochaetota bacterium]